MVRSALASWSASHLGSGSPQPVNLQQMSLGLHRGAAAGNTALVLYALENGQSPNTTLHGVTPLHVAAATGNSVILQLLLANGAEVNATRARSRQHVLGVEGSTPLHFAAANGNTHAVYLLLANGALPAPLDREGNTPEALALAAGHEDIAFLLSQQPHSGRIAPGSARGLGYVPELSWGGSTIAGDLNAAQPMRASPAVLTPPPIINTQNTYSPQSTSTSTGPAAQVPRPSNTALAQLRSKTTSPHREKRPTLPFFFEKAVNPAASLRAAISSHASVSEDDEQCVPAAQNTRQHLLSSKKSLSAIFRRATGTRDSPPPISDIPHAGDISRESIRTPPSSIQPHKQLTSRLSRERQQTPLSSPPQSSAPHGPQNTRLRSSSISGLVPAVDQRGLLRPPVLRARANSEAHVPNRAHSRSPKSPNLSGIVTGPSPTASPAISPAASSVGSTTLASPGASRTTRSSPGARSTSPSVSFNSLSEHVTHAPVRLDPLSFTGACVTSPVEIANSPTSPSPSAAPMSAEVLSQLLGSQEDGVDEYGHSPLAALLASWGEQVGNNGAGNSGETHGHV